MNVTARKSEKNKDEYSIEIGVGTDVTNVCISPLPIWKLFPSSKVITFINVRSGLVASAYEKDNCGFCLEVYSLHNSADGSTDYNSTLFHKSKSLDDILEALKDFIES